MTRHSATWFGAVFSGALAISTSAWAQGYIGDARRLAMGGSGEDTNIASSLIPAESQGTVIVLPVGLIRAVGNFRMFDPSHASFDPVAAMETAASPLHYTFGRASGGAASTFVSALVNGELSRDLSAYRGFKLPTSMSAGGVAAPLAGKTFRFARRQSGGYQGIFVGAGPYLTADTRLGVDARLSEVFGADEPRSFPNTSYEIQNTTAVQFALATTVGYRARIALSPSAGEIGARDGLYLAVNYRDLYGFRYFEPTIRSSIATDATGLISSNSDASTLVIDDVRANHGRGRAVDVGVEMVRGRWQGGFGVNGIGNRIRWSGFTTTRHTMNGVTDSGDFADQATTILPDARVVRMPVSSSGHLSYVTGAWAGSVEMGNGYSGRVGRTGIERRFGSVAVRAGARYARSHWDPTVGVGLGRRIALDLGIFGSHANLERERRIGVAASIRITR